MNGPTEDLSVKRGFFDLPAEIRLLVYERYCDLMRRELSKSSNEGCKHQMLRRRRSYADTMHVQEFKYHETPHQPATTRNPIDSNPAYDLFVDMKLVSRQMQAEFAPVWFRHWVFQLPRPSDPWSLDLYPAEDDPESFRQMKHFIDRVGAGSSKHVKRMRLTRHLRAREEPERAVEMEAACRLAGMLEEAGDGLHKQLVVHVQVRCGEPWPSNKRASKDVIFRRRHCEWDCICDGPTTVSFERGWV